MTSSFEVFNFEHLTVMEKGQNLKRKLGN